MKQCIWAGRRKAKPKQYILGLLPRIGLQVFWHQNFDLIWTEILSPIFENKKTKMAKATDKDSKRMTKRYVDRPTFGVTLFFIFSSHFGRATLFGQLVALLT